MSSTDSTTGLAPTDPPPTETDAERVAREGVVNNAGGNGGFFGSLGAIFALIVCFQPPADNDLETGLLNHEDDIGGGQNWNLFSRFCNCFSAPPTASSDDDDEEIVGGGSAPPTDAGEVHTAFPHGDNQEIVDAENGRVNDRLAGAGTSGAGTSGAGTSGAGTSGSNVNLAGQNPNFFSRNFNWWGTPPANANGGQEEAGQEETNAEDKDVWNRFVEKGNHFVQWLLGTVFLFVPASYLVQGESDPKDKPAILSAYSYLTDELQSKLPDFFLPTMLLYIGFYMGSMLFRTKKVVRGFQAVGLVLGLVATVESLAYVGFEASMWAAGGFVFLVAVLTISKASSFGSSLRESLQAGGQLVVPENAYARVNMLHSLLHKTISQHRLKQALAAESKVAKLKTSMQRLEATASKKPPITTSLFGRMALSFRSSPNLAAAAEAAALAVIRPVEAKYPALLFKQQLAAYVEKIFGMIRDNLKQELSALISMCIQAPRISKGGVQRSGRSLGKDSPAIHWQSIIDGSILLPNSTNVTLTLTNPESNKISMKNFVNLVKEEYEKTRKNCILSGKMRKRVDWNLAAKSYLEFNGEKIKQIVRFDKFKPDFCNIIRLDNIWDLTPDTDLLKELPQTYSFETAIADLIWLGGGKVEDMCQDGKTPSSGLSYTYKLVYHGCSNDEHRDSDKAEDNSLQAVWSCSRGDRRLISVDVLEDRISIFDSWGKIGASLHRYHKSKAIGSEPPYLMVEIFESECKIPEIYQLQCRLKNIYFPYIQDFCDEISKTGRTERPVEFQVNGEDLAELTGGEVATINLNSKGREFWFQIRFVHSEMKKGSLTSQEANARLKFAYFPIVRETESIYKESIDIILESLGKEGYKASESFETFSRLSVRRLGRLLPEVPWVSLLWSQFAGLPGVLTVPVARQGINSVYGKGRQSNYFAEMLSTDLASQNPFSLALKKFGSKSKEKDNDVNVALHRKGEALVCN
ncbi:unnamed protein product [Arabidopsis arenosa]|uniref:Uncharacterized protein n=1 Tax=Arabidopsis arenosa TaxID=38785 RepID=A0A8S2AM54_ARAAE|nr:unnamed protein product [Arabidopsis arenosa]